MSDRGGTSTPFSGDAWIESKVDISIPSGMKDVEPKTYSITGLHHRSLVPVMKAAITNYPCTTSEKCSSFLGSHAFHAMARSFAGHSTIIMYIKFIKV
jgi:hypothetical protein